MVTQGNFEDGPEDLAACQYLRPAFSKIGHSGEIFLEWTHSDNS